MARVVWKIMKHETGKLSFLLVLYVVVSLALFLYSYTQVDLNLTLSRISIWQAIQRSFQYIGYWERPLSTGLYITILLALFGLYGVTLAMISRKAIGEQSLWKIIAVLVGFLLLSYPAFSADMFNYMFTAKTVLVYHKNPYAVLPIQFSGVEPWLTFMRWIHLPSAYTPIWIGLTLPFYVFGFGYFLLVLWNMKLFVAGFYIASVWLIGKILEKVGDGRKVLGMAILALNPLIVIESLVSAHNDIAMMALALGACYVFLLKKRMGSWIFLSLSAGIKLMTVFLVPVFFAGWKRGWALIAMIVALIFVLLRPGREFLPWYFVWVMPFVALLPDRPLVTVSATGMSLGLLLRYAPYLYFGDWNPPVQTIIWWANVAAPLVFTASFILFTLLRSRGAKAGNAV